MAPPYLPILIFGFDFELQKRLHFGKIWAASFLHPRFINEDHPQLQGLYHNDQAIKREVRYGNNVAMLFRAAVHLGNACGQPEGTYFWPALAKAFGTQPELIQDFVETLTQARRKQRHLYAKETSDTARAADMWIEFVDRCRSNDITIPSTSEMDGILKRFLDGFRNTQVNAANVPLTGRPPSVSSNQRRPPPNVSTRPPPPIKTEFPPTSRGLHSGLSSARKRSASPTRTPTSATKRARHNVEDQPHAAIPQAGDHSTTDERRDSLGMMPPPTSAHSVASQPLLGPPTDQRPHASYENQVIGDESAASTDKSVNTAEPRMVAAPGAEQPNRTEDRSSATGDVADPNQQLLEEATALVETNPQTEVVPTHGGVPEGGLEGEVKHMKDVMEMMMDSMHAIADNLHYIKDGIAEVKQTQPATSALLEPIQSLANNVTLLRDEVATLKNQSRQPAPDDDLRSLVEAQGQLIRQMSAQLNAVASQQARTHAVLNPPVRTVGQAMKAAEHDLIHHLKTVRALLDQSNKVASKQASIQTAEFLIALEDGLKCARAGLQS
ncbi:hypothetical protein OQA88_8058 [Cercophora sp. LCS_1]